MTTYFTIGLIFATIVLIRAYLGREHYSESAKQKGVSFKDCVVMAMIGMLVLWPAILIYIIADTLLEDKE